MVNIQRGIELRNMMDDNAHLILNDGSPTHSSYSYNTEDTLDESIVSPDIYPYCKWAELQDIGSGHLPILVEIKWKQKTLLNKKKYWNFKKANRERYRDLVDNEILSNCPTENKSMEDLDAYWIFFKTTIFKAAGQAMPRGNHKRFPLFFMHRSPMISPY